MPGSKLESIDTQEVMEYLYPKPTAVAKIQQKRKSGTLQISNKEKKLIAAQKKEIDKSLDLLHAYGEYNRFLKVSKHFIKKKCVRSKSKTTKQAGKAVNSKYELTRK